MYRGRRRDRTVEFGKWIRVEGTYVGRLCSAQLNGQVMMETQQWKLELGSQNTDRGGGNFSSYLW